MAENTLDPPAHRRTLLLLAKAGVTTVVIWWLFQIVDVDRTLALLQTIDPVPLVAALMVLLAQAAAGALRWRSIVLLQGGRLGVLRAMQLFFLGTFFNQTLSSTVGGDAIRVWRLKAAGVTLGRAAGGVALERLAGLLTMGVLAAAALPLVRGPALFALFLLAGTSVLAAGLIALGIRLGSPGSPWRRIIEDAHTILLSRDGTAVLGLSLLIHLSGALALWAVALGVGLEVPLLPCLVLVPPAMLIATLPISLGGWGVREGVLVAAFGIVGVPADAALAVSVAFGLLVMASGVVGLAVWFAGRHRD